MKTVQNFLLILILLGTGMHLNAQNEKPEGKIKSIIVYQEKYDMLVYRKDKELEQYFDIRGNLLEDITYKQGKISKHFKYQYDSDNNKIREEEYDQAGHLMEYSEYSYEN